VIPDWMQVGVVGFTLLGAASTSRMYGPLVMLPTLVATFCIVLQAHPQRLLRNLTWGMGIVAIAAPMLLELAGVLPPSYLFEDGRIVIVPQMHALPRTESIALLLSTSIAMTIVPCVFIGRLRVALTQAQRQLLLQAWNFRQLGGQLVDAAPPR
jgi:serine/threonine-protein kinase